jgi:cobalamin biosynthesis protein CobC
VTESWRWHGGGIQAARAHFGDGPAPWLDLSTGINPHCWPGTEALALDWRRLPEEDDLRALEAAAAAHFGTDPDHVCALPGTEIGLRLTGDILPRPARFVAPSYRTHGDMFGGAEPGVFEPGQGTLILANPNNPDGRVIAPQRLLGYPEWLVVDEAFADCDPATSIAAQVSDHRKLVIFRSFGKFFGLAGVRLGFVLGPRPILARFRALLGAWPVSAAAITIGTRAYRDREWIEAMRGRLLADRRALDAVLRRHGHDAAGHCPLFRLIETDNAAALFETLARQAILTRPFDYAADWLRIGLPGSAEALDRLDRALRHG